ncbi:hypothetical protein DFS33DRAFT_1451841 [Desarmillaria ectypa]|nr:hypothetical protein DFS33DRAFT_1451841 [Desarmillaria ectypa]
MCEFLHILLAVLTRGPPFFRILHCVAIDKIWIPQPRWQHTYWQALLKTIAQRMRNMKLSLINVILFAAFVHAVPGVDVPASMEGLTPASPDTAFRRSVDVPASMEGLTGASPDTAFRRGVDVPTSMEGLAGETPDVAFKRGVDVPASMEGLTGASPETAFKRSQLPNFGNCVFRGTEVLLTRRGKPGYCLLARLRPSAAAEPKYVDVLSRVEPRVETMQSLL